MANIPNYGDPAVFAATSMFSTTRHEVNPKRGAANTTANALIRKIALTILAVAGFITAAVLLGKYNITPKNYTILGGILGSAGSVLIGGSISYVAMKTFAKANRAYQKALNHHSKWSNLLESTQTNGKGYANGY
ncbi:MAG: hypothetical protein SP1CHLAM54_15630 [Chlamydiia bacterium]|nr:hypothetical protein [Chlamydiia bacterium]MCH9616453.1 hypothetical protein [Chlamydiia bacterium]MCH9629561.1 hypothetical protein [Chlamydiia bacterium]